MNFWNELYCMLWPISQEAFRQCRADKQPETCTAMKISQGGNSLCAYMFLIMHILRIYIRIYITQDNCLHTLLHTQSHTYCFKCMDMLTTCFVIHLHMQLQYILDQITYQIFMIKDLGILCIFLFGVKHCNAKYRTNYILPQLFSNHWYWWIVLQDGGDLSN